MPELNSEQRKNLRNAFIRGVQGLVSGDPGVTIGGEPVEDFLAGPAPTNPFSGWQHNAGRRVCRRWAASRSPSILPGHDLYYRNLCTPYIENEFGPLGDGTAAPPYLGGQCPSTYIVFATTNGVDLFIGGQTPLNIMGPLGAVTFTEVLVGSPSPDSTRFEWRFAGDPLLVLQFTARKSFTPDPGFRIAGRVDGGPDNCGNLSDDWSPGTGPTIPPETGPIPDPPGWPIPDFDIDITVDPDGSIEIVFGDGEPPEEIDPFPPGGDGGPPALPPGDQGEPGEPEEAGDNDAEGCAPEGQVLVGLRLQLIETGPRPKIYPGGVYRGAAYVYMGGDVSLDQDFAGSLLIDDQFVYAERDNLTCWRVRANGGFRWSVTPHYRAAE